MVGYAVENLKSNDRGMVDVAALAAQMNEDVAALMVTNPKTLGVFEQEIHKIADLMHEKGGPALHGRRQHERAGRQSAAGDFGVDVMHLNLHKTFSTPHGGGGPGSGPVAIKKSLEPFLPTPVVITKSDGTMAFDYNVLNPWDECVPSMETSACSSARWPTFRQRPGWAAPDHRRRRPQRELHPQGARSVYDLPYDTPSMHEVVFSDKIQSKKGVKTMDLAKRLIDYGFHPYTTAFPLIVPAH